VWRCAAQCPALSEFLISSPSNPTGIVGDTTGGSSRACTNGLAMAANTGCGIKCDTTSTAHAPNGYVKISGPSNPQEIACSASNQLDAITLVCGLKQPSFPSVTITATDPANQAISSGSYNDAAVITFSFAIKDGGNQAMSLPQLGSTFATTDITKTNCNAPPSPSPQFAGSGSAYMLYCSANNGQAVSVTVRTALLLARGWLVAASNWALWLCLGADARRGFHGW
jgi:hypothetical protein